MIPRMFPAMNHHAGSLTEALLANIAYVRFYTFVCQLVHSQRHLRAKILRADLTLNASFSGVYHSVQLEGTVATELLATHRAQITFSVHFPVFPKLMSVFEHLFANVATQFVVRVYPVSDAFVGSQKGFLGVNVLTPLTRKLFLRRQHLTIPTSFLVIPLVNAKTKFFLVFVLVYRFRIHVAMHLSLMSYQLFSSLVFPMARVTLPAFTFLVSF